MNGKSERMEKGKNAVERQLDQCSDWLILPYIKIKSPLKYNDEEVNTFFPSFFSTKKMYLGFTYHPFGKLCLQKKTW